MNQPGFFVVDASVWTARLVPQDIFHQAVKTWMERQRLAGMTLLSPALLLVEVAGAISRRTGDANLAWQAVDRLERLPGLRLVQMDYTLVKESARLAANLGLRGADAVYVGLAVILNLPLTTLDMDQRKRAASQVIIQTIEEIT
jgi:predicted nucleic acid-binding protein